MFGPQPYRQGHELKNLAKVNSEFSELSGDSSAFKIKSQAPSFNRDFIEKERGLRQPCFDHLKVWESLIQGEQEVISQVF